MQILYNEDTYVYYCVYKVVLVVLLAASGSHSNICVLTILGLPISEFQHIKTRSYNSMSGLISYLYCPWNAVDISSCHPHYHFFVTCDATSVIGVICRSKKNIILINF